MRSLTIMNNSILIRTRRRNKLNLCRNFIRCVSLSPSLCLCLFYLFARERETLCRKLVTSKRLQMHTFRLHVRVRTQLWAAKISLQTELSIMIETEVKGERRKWNWKIIPLAQMLAKVWFTVKLFTAALEYLQKRKRQSLTFLSVAIVVVAMKMLMI